MQGEGWSLIVDLKALQAHRRSTTTASGPVSYLDVGQGRPAVFIHGLIANSLLWRHVISAVASDQRRCIAIDLPGHGHTPPAEVNADVSLTGLACRVIELCDHLDLDRFDLVANDTGGAVAQIVAAHAGERLSTFTLTNCDTEGNTPPTLFMPITIAARLGLITRVGPHLAARRHLVQRVLGIGYQHPRRLPDQVVDAYATPVLGTEESSRALSRIITALSSADLIAVRPQLAALTAPTLIVWGTGDPLFHTKWAHRLAQLIPSTVAVRLLDGVRMHFPDEHAHLFVPHLRQHWDSPVEPARAHEDQ
ncbi:alpha/beta fold hydrolase [Mycobacterium asiaticum]|uniref:alpha/beta fold hydrolase n=1 Tax=Mycobacterium asiaticum TaxID=1790 RepID=UPI000AED34EA|nr:alpha/beta hydrolase [Mycobacterium asiaticum]